MGKATKRVTVKKKRRQPGEEKKKNVIVGGSQGIAGGVGEGNTRGYASLNPNQSLTLGTKISGGTWQEWMFRPWFFTIGAEWEKGRNWNNENLTPWYGGGGGSKKKNTQNENRGSNEMLVLNGLGIILGKGRGGVGPPGESRGTSRMGERGGPVGP